MPKNRGNVTTLCPVHLLRPLALAAALTVTFMQGQNLALAQNAQPQQLVPVPVTPAPKASDTQKQSGLTPHNAEGTTQQADKNKSSSQQMEYGAYLASLYGRIKLAWSPPKGTRDKTIVAQCEILKTGQIINEKITTSSQQPQADAAVLSALKNASPHRPFPSSWPDKINLQLTFHLNEVHGDKIDDVLKTP